MLFISELLRNLKVLNPQQALKSYQDKKILTNWLIKGLKLF
jgi:hypothetical protein